MISRILRIDPRDQQRAVKLAARFPGRYRFLPTRCELIIKQATNK